LPQGDAPAVARRRIRLALRKAREESGLTLQEVADSLCASVSKVIRIEQGAVTVSKSDLLALFRLYGVSDAAATSALVEDVRLARSRTSEWADPERWKHLPPGLLELMQFERSATALRCFHTTLVPGLLQTPEYAGALFDSFRGELSKDTDADREVRAARLQARVNRSTQVLDRAEPPEFYGLMDESVLHREIGGRAITAAQLRMLVKLMERPTVRLRVLPFTAGAPVAVQGPFIIVELDGVDAVLYREVYKQDELDHDEARVARYRATFERLWELSLDDDASAQRIADRAQALADPG
jgi:transcriptional regulator with XRE-family HTH domain